MDSGGLVNGAPLSLSAVSGPAGMLQFHRLCPSPLRSVSPHLCSRFVASRPRALYPSPLLRCAPDRELTARRFVSVSLCRTPLLLLTTRQFRNRRVRNHPQSIDRDISLRKLPNLQGGPCPRALRIRFRCCFQSQRLYCERRSLQGKHRVLDPEDEREEEEMLKSLAVLCLAGAALAGPLKAKPTKVQFIASLLRRFCSIRSIASSMTL